MGSYASVGPVLAARLLGVPVVLHEANAVPGKAVSFLARFAQEVCVTFESTAEHIQCRRVTRTGLPMREKSRGPEEDRSTSSQDRPLVLLVSGGSQGAAILNTIVPEALARVVPTLPGLQVVHLSGAGRDTELRSVYTEKGISHRVFAFSQDMPSLYREADLAICRAGAATCCELALYELPALLVPHPTAGGGHQRLNAEALQSLGGAEMLLQSELTAESLAERILSLMGDAALRLRMREGVAHFAVPDAAQSVARCLLRHGSASGRQSA